MALPRSGLGAALVLLLPAVSILSGVDGMAKYLSGIGYSVLQIVWARYVFQTLLTFPFAWRKHGRALLRPTDLPAQAARSLLHATSTFLIFMAFARMPLADAIAIFFVYPFVVTAVAPLMLGERAGWRRWVACIVGFPGTLFVIKPDFGGLEAGAIFSIAGSIAFAFYILLTRRVALSTDATMTIFLQGLVAAVALSFVVALDWRMPDPGVWLLLVALGAVSALGHFMIIRAYTHAPASLLAPFGYFEIVAATIIGLTVFGDFPDAWSWLGIAIIVASGIYISWRERRVTAST
ncbi:MAG: DMT family transporter [Rhodospirillales bacterium]|nr:DMT family transporter [Rhodospirillales bacterium]